MEHCWELYQLLERSELSVKFRLGLYCVLLLLLLLLLLLCISVCHVYLCVTWCCLQWRLWPNCEACVGQRCLSILFIFWSLWQSCLTCSRPTLSPSPPPPPPCLPMDLLSLPSLSPLPPPLMSNLNCVSTHTQHDSLILAMCDAILRCSISYLTGVDSEPVLRAVLL